MPKQLDIGKCKPVATPGTREEGRSKPGDEAQDKFEESLGDERASMYRALVARANHLAPGRLDIAYAVKELARGMREPTVGDWC